LFIDIKVKKINHPGREMNIVNIRKSIIPATPPSKGGETFSNHCIYNTTLRFTAFGIDGLKLPGVDPELVLLSKYVKNHSL
jgi:hypothetical protein